MVPDVTTVQPSDESSSDDACGSRQVPRPRRPGEGGCAGLLTPTEVEVVRLVAMGLTDAAVVAARHVSAHTVRHHVAAAMRKGGAQSRTELVAKCYASGLFEASWPPTLAAVVCLCSVIRAEQALHR